MPQVYDESGNSLYPRGYGPVKRQRQQYREVVVQPKYRVEQNDEGIPVWRKIGQATRWIGKHVTKPILRRLDKNFNEGFFDNMNNSVSNLLEDPFDSSRYGDMGKTIYYSPRGQRTVQGVKDWYNRLGAPDTYNGPKLIDGPGAKRLRLGPGPKAITAKSPMKRKYSLRTTGSYGGKFSGRKYRKISSASFKGCVLTYESNGTVSDSSCAYIGHNSHPLYLTLRAIGWSIARLLAKKWGIDFTNFNHDINGPDATAASDIRMVITKRTTFNGICNDSTVTLSNMTWAQLGDQIAHHLLAECSSSDIFYEIVRLKFAQKVQSISAGAGSEVHTIPEPKPPIILHGSHLKISVSGWSKLKLQNQTVSASGDAVATEQVDDITNNPLTGKKYFGKGQYHLMKFIDDYDTSAPALYYASDYGLLTLAPETATSLEGTALKVLRKPQNYKVFGNCFANCGVKLGPGEIKSSVVKKSYSMSLNKWIKFLFPVFRSSANIFSAPTGHHMCQIGSNSFFAFEHMVNTGSEPSVDIGYQLDNRVKAVAYHKRKLVCCADFQTGIATVTLEDDPAQS